ncbi:MAG: hypothetical protein JEZ00_08550 [Anaerolineaceae bacterium]|nr:hypothetical protein [Anaerolineaceae bacterium]
MMEMEKDQTQNHLSRAQHFFSQLTQQVLPHAEAMILHIDDPEAKKTYTQEKEKLIALMSYGWILAASMNDDQHQSYTEAWRDRLDSTANDIDYSAKAKKEELLTNLSGKMREYLITQLFSDDPIAFAQCWFINIVSMDGTWKFLADVLEKEQYSWQDFKMP